MGNNQPKADFYRLLFKTLQAMTPTQIASRPSPIPIAGAGTETFTVVGVPDASTPTVALVSVGERIGVATNVGAGVTTDVGDGTGVAGRGVAFQTSDKFESGGTILSPNGPR